MVAEDGELVGLYDGLARFQWFKRRLGRSAKGHDLEMHKRLRAPQGDGPGAGVGPLNDWLWDRLSLGEGPDVLDVGCGFGGTLFAWAAKSPAGTFHGLTLSPYQARKARNEARRLKLEERCAFRVQSYDDPISGTYDALVSVESLFHSPGLPRTLSGLARVLAPGGRFVLVEDMAQDGSVAQCSEARELLSTWSTLHLHTSEDYERAVEQAGLSILEAHDLSAQVEHSDPTRLRARADRMRTLRRLTPSRTGRRIIDAFLGGLALEQLYARGQMRYRMLMVGGRA